MHVRGHFCITITSSRYGQNPLHVAVPILLLQMEQGMAGASRLGRCDAVQSSRRRAGIRIAADFADADGQRGVARWVSCLVGMRVRRALMQPRFLSAGLIVAGLSQVCWHKTLNSLSIKT
jgi:hypothetical protein